MMRKSTYINKKMKSFNIQIGNFVYFVYMFFYCIDMKKKLTILILFYIDYMPVSKSNMN